jgi:hypothetical protein
MNELIALAGKFHVGAPVSVYFTAEYVVCPNMLKRCSLKNIF